MKQVIPKVTICLLLGTRAMLAPAQQADPQNTQTPEIQSSTAVTGTATVQDIDYADRIVALRDQNGKVFTVRVGEEARNFNNIHKGDQVTFRRQETLALALRKSDEPPSTAEAQTVLRAPAGQKPSGEVINSTQVTATVENIDRQKREVSLRMPDGTTRTLKAESKNGPTLERLQPGDQVVATYTDSFMVDVAAPK